ncbi:hypothetical protein T484DRAFT_1973861 [Baffinella frigidus]|nr:hypothetical protein T484DRAFT_1973861 [Cryptophyta sp. CCMP2293]
MRGGSHPPRRMPPAATEIPACAQRAPPAHRTHGFRDRPPSAPRVPPSWRARSRIPAAARIFLARPILGGW